MICHVAGSALASFYATTRYAELKANYSGYARHTGFVTEGDDGIAAVWHSFNTTIPNTLKRGIPGESSLLTRWDPTTLTPHGTPNPISPLAL